MQSPCTRWPFIVLLFFNTSSCGSEPPPPQLITTRWLATLSANCLIETTIDFVDRTIFNQRHMKRWAHHFGDYDYSTDDDYCNLPNSLLQTTINFLHKQPYGGQSIRDDGEEEAITAIAEFPVIDIAKLLAKFGSEEALDRWIAVEPTTYTAKQQHGKETIELVLPIITSQIINGFIPWAVPVANNNNPFFGRHDFRDPRRTCIFVGLRIAVELLRRGMLTKLIDEYCTEPSPSTELLKQLPVGSLEQLAWLFDINSSAFNPGVGITRQISKTLGIIAIPPRSIQDPHQRRRRMLQQLIGLLILPFIAPISIAINSRLITE